MNEEVLSVENIQEELGELKKLILRKETSLASDRDDVAVRLSLIGLRNREQMLSERLAEALKQKSFFHGSIVGGRRSKVKENAEGLMASQEEMKSEMIEVLGARMRVRVPASNIGDLHHAAELVRQKVQERRAAGDKPENAAITVALDIAYEAILSHRKMERAVSQLLDMLDESERQEAEQIVSGKK